MEDPNDKNGEKEKRSLKIETCASAYEKYGGERDERSCIINHAAVSILLLDCAWFVCLPLVLRVHYLRAFLTAFLV